MWFCRKVIIFKKKSVLLEQSLAFSRRSQKTTFQELFTSQPGNFLDLPEAFQASKFNCSALLPAVAHTDSQLELMLLSKSMKRRIISSPPCRRWSKYQVTVLVEPNEVAHNRILKAEMQLQHGSPRCR